MKLPGNPFSLKITGVRRQNIASMCFHSGKKEDSMCHSYKRNEEGEQRLMCQRVFLTFVPLRD